MYSLENKVIVVTGATGILGGSFIKAIAENGGKVVLIGQNKEVGTQREKEINDAGGIATFVAANVLDEADLIIARDIIVEKYGRIDGLVNAAGGNIPEGVLPPTGDIFNMNIEGMKNALVLNIWGTVIPTQIFGQVMVQNGGGSIVNISSVSPKRAITRVLGYSMGKAAIDIYTKWFALEVANRHGDTIRVNSIMPGFFLTNQNRNLLTNPDGSLTERGGKIIAQTPFKRFGNPEELNGALLFLLSDASKFVTGMDLGVDGGFTINSGV